MTEVLLQEQPVAPRVVRRNRPGSKRSEWCNWPDQQFNQIESIHAQQMLIQQRIRNNKNNVEFILTPPEGADEEVWKYEHLRQFCQELNGLAARLQTECSPETCSQVVHRYLPWFSLSRWPLRTSGSSFARRTSLQKNAQQLTTPATLLTAQLCCSTRQSIFPRAWAWSKLPWRNWALFQEECTESSRMLSIIINTSFSISRLIKCIFVNYFIVYFFQFAEFWLFLESNSTLPTIQQICTCL